MDGWCRGRLGDHSALYEELKYCGKTEEAAKKRSSIINKRTVIATNIQQESR